LLGSRRLADSVIISFERQHLIEGDGSGSVRDVVRHPGGVAVLAIDGDRVWLVSQRRAPFGTEMLEVPAGRLDPTDADPAAAALRELEEELGAVPERMIPLGRMRPSPGYTDEVIHLFAAIGLRFGDRTPDGVDEREAVTVERRLDDLLHSIEEGELTDAKTQLSLLLWARRKDRE
jgi:ADP-ribose pyrophosphatase